MTTDGEGCRTALDSDEKLEAAFKSHQQRLPTVEKISSFSQVDLEIVNNLGSRLTALELQELEDRDLVVCDGCGEMLAAGLGYKCLHCNSVHVCANCETLSEKHSDHLLISCLVLIGKGSSTNKLISSD